MKLRHILGGLVVFGVIVLVLSVLSPGTVHALPDVRRVPAVTLRDSLPGDHTWETTAEFASGTLTDTRAITHSVRLTKTVGDDYVATGEYLSAVYDAGGLVDWASLTYTATVPTSTTLTLYTRGGNVAAPDVHWSDWFTHTAPTQALPQGVARYVQFKVAMTSALTTATPVLDAVSVVWDGFSYTAVPAGLINSDTTWTAANSPYLVTGNLQVSEGVSLTVEPGVTVWMSDTRAIQILGQLTALGTAAQPITFTSWHVQGQPDDWGALAFSDTAVDAVFDDAGNYLGGSAFQYATVEYAGSGSFSYAIDGGNNAVYVDHCTIQDNDSGGIRMSGGQNHLTHNTVSDNANTGIYNAGSSAVIADNIVSNNDGRGIQNTGSAATIKTNTIMSNTVSGSGGGIHTSANCIIADNFISGNSTTAGHGGGIYSSSNSIIENNKVTNNSAYERYGCYAGGIYSSGGGRVYSNFVVGNSTSSHYSDWNFSCGGGIYSSGCDVEGNYVSQNISNNAKPGGGICSNNGMVLSNVVISNTAQGNGGGIYWRAGIDDLAYNTITGNTSSGDTGGIYVNSSYPPIHQNSFQSNGGYALYNNNAYGDGSVHLDARHNYWGTADDATIRGLIFDWYDDSGKSVVDYTPYLAQPEPALTIVKSGPSLVNRGNPITYTLTVENFGPAAATNLVITDALPAGAHYVSGGTLVGDEVQWQLATLDAYTSTQVGFVVTATETITNHTYGVRADGDISATGTTTVTTEAVPLGATIEGPAAGLRDTNYTFTATAGHSKISYLSEINGASSIQYLGEDTTTQGNWGGTYGSDGYVLVNWNSGSNVQDLPGYVENISYSSMTHCMWDSDTTDVRALPAHPDNSGTRRAACGFKSSAFEIDIRVQGTDSHGIAFYILDWDSYSRQQTIELRDATTDALLATSGTLQDYHNGKYIRFVFQGDVKVRITHEGGVNAVLSGIFFDSSNLAPPALPVTFAWEAAGHAPVTRTVNSASDTFTAQWPTLGDKAITVTVSNRAGVARATHTFAVHEPLTAITVNGSTEALVGESHVLTASVGPVSATEPIAYYWRTEEMSAAISAGASDAVMHLPLDEPAGATTFQDVSGHGNDGTCSGSSCPVAGASGRLGNAAQFDGNDDYIIKNPINNFPTTEITVLFWTKVVASNDVMHPVSYASAANDNEFLIRSSPSFQITTGSQNVILEDKISIDDGYWHHVGVTWRSSDGQVKIYKDGIEVYVSILAPGTTIRGNGSFVIGQDQDTVGGGFDPRQAFAGLIDDLRIYNRVLSASEIQALASAGSLGNKTSTASLIWNTPGPKAITTTASNPVSAVTTTYSVDVYSATAPSTLYDAGDLVTWDDIAWTPTPVTATVKLAVRLGNTRTPTDSHWSDWYVFDTSPADLIHLPPSRYLQWRAHYLDASAPSLNVTPSSTPLNYTVVSGQIAADTTWTAANSPYLVQGIMVNENKTLTIEPGVTVWVSDGRAIQVLGGLEALGTAAQPITFTSWHVRGQPGDWAGIVFDDVAADAVFDGNGAYQSGSAFQYATVEYGSSGYDYAIDASHTALYIDHTTIRHNTSGGARTGAGEVYLTHNHIHDNGGRGLHNTGAPATIAGNHIANNTATGSGGGIYNTGGGTVADNLVTGNSATVSGYDDNAHGGGIYHTGGGTITRNTVSDNSARVGDDYSYGGGIYSSGNVDITHNTVTGNSAHANGYHCRGGGIHSDGGTVAHNVVTGNSCYAGYYRGHSRGGGIYGPDSDIENNDVQQNTVTGANACGGGIYHEGNGDIKGNTLVGNTGEDQGGGICNYNAAVSISDNDVFSNTTSGIGGGVYNNASSAILNGNIITGNHADGVGGGVWWNGDAGEITYNTIVSNTSYSVTWGIHVNSYPIVRYNLLEGQGDYALYNNNTWGVDHLDARYNWWSTADEPTIEGLIHGWSPSTQDKSIVDYNPYYLSRPALQPEGINLSGPAAGVLDTAYTFDASVIPNAVMPPLTYTWQASGQTPVVYTGPDMRHTATFSWTTEGTQAVTVANPKGTVNITHAIAIGNATAPDIYEVDDTCPEAQSITTDGAPQDHTFHTLGNEDWVSFQATAGITYAIQAVVPNDSEADVALEVYDSCSGVPQEGQDPAFSTDINLSFQAPQTGPIYLRFRDRRTQVGTQSASYQVSVREVPPTDPTGAVVLVAGKRSDSDPLQTNINNVAKNVYRLFLANGYSGDDIYFLAPEAMDADGDGQSDVDQTAPAKVDLRDAITQWAVNEGGVDADHPFTLFMVDHGNHDLYYLHRGQYQIETISPFELDGWLDTLEAAAPGVKVNVIIEACKSGSFIDLAQSVSQPGRVVIGSTGAYALAYASQDGATFSDSFVAALGRGMSLHTSFVEGQLAVQQAHPAQTPWIDDNGNGIPNEADDGQVAAQRGFSQPGTFADLDWPPNIAIASVDQAGGEIAAQVQVQEGKSLVEVVALIYAPSYEPPTSEEEMVQANVPQVTLRDPDGDGLYTADYDFTEAGTYRVVVYAEDSMGIQARPKQAGASGPLLSIEKDGPVSANAGEPITYTLTVTNTGTGAATNLLITDTIPADATYLRGGTLVGDEVQWAVASLNAGDGVEVQFSVTADQTVTNDEYAVHADEGVGAVGAVGVTTLVNPTPPTLQIRKTGPIMADIGAPVTYTLAVTNTGSTAATNLVITDVIPSGAYPVDTSGGTLQLGVVRWEIPSLVGEGGVAHVSFAVTATQTITNERYGVRADDGVWAQGERPVITYIGEEPRPALRISKRGPVSVTVSAPITYTLTVYNDGGAPAENLIISDTLPAGATYVSGGTLISNVVRWNMSTLNAGSTANVQFVVTATETITNSDYRVNADGGMRVVGEIPVVTHISPSDGESYIYLPLVLRR